MMIKRRSGETAKSRRPLRPPKKSETIYNSTLLYLKFVLVWGGVLLADFMLDVRFEYLWPVWLFLQSVHDTYKYQGLAFSLFFSCLSLTSDIICSYAIRDDWIFFLASSYVWVQYVWHTERGICFPTIALWFIFVYVEAAVRLKDLSKDMSHRVNLCRPFAAHSIGYPVVTLGFGFKSYISYKLRLRKQQEVQKENDFYFQLLKQALPKPTIGIEEYSLFDDDVNSPRANGHVHQPNGTVVSNNITHQPTPLARLFQPRDTSSTDRTMTWVRNHPRSSSRASSSATSGVEATSTVAAALGAGGFSSLWRTRNSSNDSRVAKNSRPLFGQQSGSKAMGNQQNGSGPGGNLGFSGSSGQTLGSNSHSAEVPVSACAASTYSNSAMGGASSTGTPASAPNVNNSSASNSCLVGANSLSTNNPKIPVAVRHLASVITGASCMSSANNTSVEDSGKKSFSGDSGCKSTPTSEDTGSSNTTASNNTVASTNASNVNPNSNHSVAASTAGTTSNNTTTSNKGNQSNKKEGGGGRKSFNGGTNSSKEPKKQRSNNASSSDHAKTSLSHSSSFNSPNCHSWVEPNNNLISSTSLAAIEGLNDLEKTEKIEKLELAVRTLTAELSGKSLVQQELTSKISSLAASERHYKQEIEQLKSDKKGLEEKVTDLSLQKVAVSQKVDNLEKRLETERKAKGEAERRALEEKNRAKRTVEEEVTKFMSDMAKKNECTSTNCGKRMKELENEKNQLQMELARKNESMMKHEIETLRLLKDELSEKGREMARVQELNSRLESNLSMENKYKMELFSALNDCNRKINNYQMELAQKNKEIMDLQYRSSFGAGGTGDRFSFAAMSLGHNPAPGSVNVAAPNGASLQDSAVMAAAVANSAAVAAQVAPPNNAYYLPAQMQQVTRSSPINMAGSNLNPEAMVYSPVSHAGIVAPPHSGSGAAVVAALSSGPGSLQQSNHNQGPLSMQNNMIPVSMVSGVQQHSGNSLMGGNTGNGAGPAGGGVGVCSDQ